MVSTAITLLAAHLATLLLEGRALAIERSPADFQSFSSFSFDAQHKPPFVSTLNAGSNNSIISLTNDADMQVRMQRFFIRLF